MRQDGVMGLKISRHKNILFQILKEICSDTSMGPALGFKGGTAAYIFYDLPRFSVDLDFDLIDEKKEEHIFEKIETLLKNYGLVKQAQRKRYSSFFLLSYEEGAQNIKIEINRRRFGSQYEIKTYLGLSVLVMKKEDMFAHKLTAMYERMGRAGRDVYDVWYFLKDGWPINRNIVEERTGMDFRQFLKKCVISVEKINEKSILQGMGELLDEKQKTWVKANLKTDLIFLLKLRLEADG